MREGLSRLLMLILMLAVSLCVVARPAMAFYDAEADGFAAETVQLRPSSVAEQQEKTIPAVIQPVYIEPDSFVSVPEALAVGLVGGVGGIFVIVATIAYAMRMRRGR